MEIEIKSNMIRLIVTNRKINSPKKALFLFCTSEVSLVTIVWGIQARLPCYTPYIPSFTFSPQDSKWLLSSSHYTTFNPAGDGNVKKKSKLFQLKTIPWNHMYYFHLLARNNKLTTPSNRGGWKCRGVI